LQGYPINFVLSYCIAAAPDPGSDYQVCKSQHWNSSNLTQPRIFLQWG